MRPMARTITAMLVLSTLVACDPSFSPPAHPPHEEEEDGALHAVRFKDPFSCGTSARSENGVACKTDGVRPLDDLLSCDAIGCHGGFDYTPNTSMTRALTGSEGPSCYTCHGDQWTEEGGGR
jgi:hypothetical protein